MNVSVLLEQVPQSTLDNPAGPLARLTNALREAARSVEIEAQFAQAGRSSAAFGRTQTRDEETAALRDAVAAAVRRAAQSIG